MNINIKQELIDAHIIKNYENELEGISTFLHEEIAQNVYAVFNHLQYLQQHIVNKDDRTTIDDMVKLTKRTIEDIRFLSNDTHPFFHKGIDGALTTFLNSFNKKHEVAVHYKSYGEKQRLPLLSELMVYRSFKDVLTQLVLSCSQKHMNVTAFWGESLHIKIEWTRDNQEMYQHEDFLLHVLGVKKKLELVGGAFSMTSTSETNKVVNIFIPNVR
ncbi:MAG: hypothetical protein ACQEWV_12310 [Bacillota bacterium]